MTLRHLEIFRAVCQLESVTLAAERLNMTQPTVSVAIRELESIYGTRLFERMNRRIYITDAGRTLLRLHKEDRTEQGKLFPIKRRVNRLIDYTGLPMRIRVNFCHGKFSFKNLNRFSTDTLSIMVQ